MKILVVPDIHIGSALSAGRKDEKTGLNTRLLDQYNSLRFVIKDAWEKGARDVVMTGDIFENRYPSISQQKLFSQALNYAVDIGYQSIHIVIGNHDQQRTTGANTLSYLQELKLTNIIVHEQISFIQEGGVFLAFLPYLDRKFLGAATHEDALKVLGVQIDALVANAQPNSTKMLVGHMALEGTFFPEEEADLYVDNELMLPKSMFKSFDITLMGHVHTPTIISTVPYIAYVGSLEKRGPSEQHAKKYALVDTDVKKVSYHDIPCRNYFEIKVAFDSVKADFLMKEIMDQVKAYSYSKNLKDGIVKCSFEMLSEDVGFFNENVVVKELYDKYGSNFVAPIKPIFRSSRKVKDATITEQVSDFEALSKYVKANFDEEMMKKLLQNGSEIIQSFQDKV